MKRREISLLLAGFLLFMIPMQMQATIALPDIVSTKQINFNKSITENIQNVTELDVTQDSADAWTVAQAASSTQSEAGQIPADPANTAPASQDGTVEVLKATTSPLAWNMGIGENADLYPKLDECVIQLFEGKFATGADFAKALDGLY